MKILLTGPNLESDKKVAGIGTVAQMIKNNSDLDYDYLTVGRDDNEKKNLQWVLKQIKIIFKLRNKIKKDIDIFHINTCLNTTAIVREFILLKILYRVKSKVILHLHGGEFLFKKSGNILIDYMIKSNYKSVKEIIVLSTLEKEKFIYRKFKNKISVLNNSIDHKNIKSNSDLFKVKNSIIFLGRISKNKGIIDIYNSLKNLNNEGVEFHFFLYGEGPLREEYVKKFSNVLESKFTYGGVISGSMKWTMLRDAEFFILPSKFEGLPMALLESMACGCIPIVTRVGSISSVVSSKNGFIFDLKSTEILIKNIKTALSLPIEVKQELSSNAINTIKSKYSSNVFYKNINQIYRNFLDEK